MSMKRCIKCGETKPIEQFSRRTRSRDGLDFWCKTCKSEHRRAWYIANQEYAKERARAWRKANPERTAETNRAWQKANPGKGAEAAALHSSKYPGRVAARKAVSQAVKRGKMPPARDLTCTTCGAPAEQYHHHLGYAPEHRLDVVAVCISCHVELDKEVN